MTITPRERMLQKKYGITEEIWEKMYTRQKGKCPICLKPIRKPGDTGRAASVDHDHVTKRVRGLLCYRCNRFVIGRTRSVDQVKRVVEYLSSTFDGRTIDG